VNRIRSGHRLQWLGGRREALSYGLDYFPAGRQHAQKSCGAAIHDGVAVHQYFELAIVAVKHVHISREFTTNPCRHTGGVESGDSIRAETKRNAGHIDLRAGTA
jgi:hypothetical protein